MKFYIIFAIVLSVVSAQQQTNCNQTVLLNSITFEHYFNGALEWPSTLSCVDNLCDKLYQGYRDVSDYTFGGCITKNLRDLKEIPDELEDQYEEVCESPKHKQKFLTQVQSCYRYEAQVKLELKEIHQKFVGMVEKLSTFSPTERTRAYYCAVLYFREAARGAYRRLCSYKAAKYFDDIIEDYEFFDCPFGECDYVRSYQVCKTRIDRTSAAELDKILRENYPIKIAPQIALPTLFKLFD